MKRMTFLLTALVAVFLISNVTAQEDKSKRASPPAQATGQVGDVTVTIDYSSPGVKGRDIWDGLVPYGKVWRTGANEATVFEVSGDVMVGGKRLPAGKYGLFTIPGEDSWVVIFNSDWKQWGSYNYDSDKDVLRIEGETTRSEELTERMTFEVGDGEVRLKWENLVMSFPLEPAA